MDEFEKFRILPEEIQARIIRGSGGGTVTKSHRESTIVDRVEDAGTKPFVKSELEWLIKVRRNIAVMCEGNGDGHIEMFSPAICRESTSIPWYSTFMCYIDMESMTVDMKYEEASGDEKKADFVLTLVDRFDSRIVKKTDIFVSCTDEGETYANVIIIDIRSMFMILRRRFENISGTVAQVLPSDITSDNVENAFINDAIDLARKYTQRVLNNIVNDIKDMRIFALLEYLLCNALILELDVDPQDYLSTYNLEIDDKQVVIDKCTILYKMITKVINTMM